MSQEDANPCTPTFKLLAPRTLASAIARAGLHLTAFTASIHYCISVVADVRGSVNQSSKRQHKARKAPGTGSTVQLSRKIIGTVVVICNTSMCPMLFEKPGPELEGMLQMTGYDDAYPGTQQQAWLASRCKQLGSTTEQIHRWSLSSRQDGSTLSLGGTWSVTHAWSTAWFGKPRQSARWLLSSKSCSWSTTAPSA